MKWEQESREKKSNLRFDPGERGNETGEKYKSKMDDSQNRRAGDENEKDRNHEGIGEKGRKKE